MRTGQFPSIVPPGNVVARRKAQHLEPTGHRLTLGGRWTALCAIIGFALSACGVSKGEQAPNIILISVDTLRADRLGFNGYDRPTSPRIDDWRLRFVNFSNAISQCSHTLGSHQSLFSSRYYLGPQVESTYLAEALTDQGYDTVAYTGGGYVSRTFGFNRGFQFFQENEGGFAVNLKRFSKWLAKRKADDRPFFAFLHGYDVHAPYLPGESSWELLVPPYDGKVKPKDTSRAQVVKEGDPDYDTLNHGSWDQADRKFYSALYDAEIRDLDFLLGSFLDKLLSQPGWNPKRDIVILLSDHGEEFWDHGGIAHGARVFQEVIHVPLLIMAPNLGSPGQNVSRMVELLDVSPTILDLAGLPPEEAFEGSSLTQLVAAKNVTTRATAFSIGVGNKATIAYPWKMIEGPNGAELFNLELDPKETTNLSAEFPKHISTLRQLQEALISATVEEDPRFRSPVDDPELAEQLKTLGYLN